MSARPILVDGLQYGRWSPGIFQQMREGGVSAIHATVAYHENFRDCVEHILAWNRRFAEHADLILPGRDAADIERASAEGRTAVFFGSQNPSVIEGDLRLVEALYALGLRFLQLSYNNQSLLCTGWREAEDTGLTLMGREVVREMNRLGMVVDMSHSSERSTLEAIAASQRPIAITHANPRWWRDTARNKSERVLDALAESGGMVGLSLYPAHLKDGSDCTRASFVDMARRLADRIGVAHIGIGSDLCQDQPDEVVRWMRVGRWTFGDPDAMGLGKAAFPAQPAFFRDNRDFPTLRAGLLAGGFSAAEVDQLLGLNWLAFMRASFGAAAQPAIPARSLAAR
ncbi:microsomal dipeptidase-like Zn-dependent dipeptidase [Angulomicrobium tetraedrale]|uniref:Microsomal dipeptidase-like Zn-dependent dipeptidase n=1 Tax=Ancylobacter tetraedralis TaxID=217068 RepID=A0A839Z1I9_9HYPH|nr:microsomal dipeptidase-like Zn-dependent dipeptidase [Ancylobacter tetraedralis]